MTKALCRWFLSRRMRNRLVHSLNGNGKGTGKSKSQSAKPEVSLEEEVWARVPEAAKRRVASQLIPSEWSVPVLLPAEVRGQAGVILARKEEIPEIVERVSATMHPVAMVLVQSAAEVGLRGYPCQRVQCTLSISLPDGERSEKIVTRHLVQLGLNPSQRVSMAGGTQLIDAHLEKTSYRMVVKFDELEWEHINGDCPRSPSTPLLSGKMHPRPSMSCAPWLTNCLGPLACSTSTSSFTRMMPVHCRWNCSFAKMAPRTERHCNWPHKLKVLALHSSKEEDRGGSPCEVPHWPKSLQWRKSWASRTTRPMGALEPQGWKVEHVLYQQTDHAVFYASKAGTAQKFHYTLPDGGVQLVWLKAVDARAKTMRQESAAASASASATGPKKNPKQQAQQAVLAEWKAQTTPRS
eukprot:1298998-Amphidinium_carterae.1